MSPELEQKLLADLNKTGFASEMKAIKAIREAGWESSGAGAYFDRDSQIMRTIDVVAHKLARSFEVGVEVDYQLFVEVKKSERPWIVFREEERTGSGGDAWNNPYVSCNPIVPLRDLNPTLKFNSIRSELGWLGYGVHEAFNKPQETGRWYSAAVTTCKACYDYIRHDSIAFLKENETERSYVIITHPVVILDGLLVSAELSPEGEPQLSEVPFAPFEFEFSTANYDRGSYRVDLVTLPAVNDFLKLIAKRVDDIYTEIYDAKRIGG